MPFIIKSSSGRRTCKLISNRTESANNTRDEIIEALRGLTIKCEVKIVDILTPDTPDNSVLSANSQEEANHVLPQETRPATKIMTRDAPSDTREYGETHRRDDIDSHEIKSPAKEMPKIDEPPRAVPEVKHDPPRDRYDEPPREKIIVKETPRERIVINEPPREKIIVKESPKEAVKKPVDRSRASESPFLIRGELKIGETVSTCCISIDEMTDPPTPYITYSNDKLLDITKSIQELSSEIEAQAKMSFVEIGSIVYGKSYEDNSWYRCLVEHSDVDGVQVYFFDWGLRETLDVVRLRRLAHLELGLSKHPACALKVRFTNPPGKLLEDALKCDSEFKMTVEGYDETTETYVGTIMST